VQALLARAALQPGSDRVATLALAQEVATEAARRAPQNARWPGWLAEIHAALADAAAAKGDTKTAAAEWKAARDLLEPLAQTGRLPAQRTPLLARARMGR
jgi:hypothetical protein